MIRTRNPPVSPRLRSKIGRGVQDDPDQMMLAKPIRAGTDCDDCSFDLRSVDSASFNLKKGTAGRKICRRSSGESSGSCGSVRGAIPIFCRSPSRTEDGTTSYSGGSGSAASDAGSRHPLYLIRSWHTCHAAPVKFSGGMSLEECDKYYRLRKLDYVIKEAAPVVRRDAVPAKIEAAKKIVRRGRNKTAGEMLRRLKKMGGGRAASPKDGSDKCRSGKESDSSFVSTASTSSLDSSNSSLSSSSHSASSVCTGDLSAASSDPRRRRPRFSIAFSPTVTYHTIPSAATYPEPVFDSIWHSKRDWRLQKQVARMEFAYDGGNWRDVKEEHDMVLCPKTLALVHPVHVGRKGQAVRKGEARRRIVAHDQKN